MRSSETLDTIVASVENATRITDRPSAIARYVASDLYQLLVGGRSLTSDVVVNYMPPELPEYQLGKAVFQLLMSSEFIGVEVATIVESDNRLCRVIISSTRLAEMSKYRFAIRQTHLHRFFSPVS